MSDYAKWFYLYKQYIDCFMTKKEKKKHVQSFVLKKVENLLVFQPPRSKSELKT